MQNCQMKQQHTEEPSVGTPDSKSAENPSHLEGTSSKERQPEKVIVKVRHKEDFIRFEICPYCGVNKIFEEVITKFELNRDTFKIKYTENNKDVLIINNDDLQLCPKFNIPTYDTWGSINNTIIYRTCIYLFVELD